MPKTAPYGSWKSPITSDLIVAQSIALSRRVSTATVYWLEGGRRSKAAIVVVRGDARRPPSTT